LLTSLLLTHLLKEASRVNYLWGKLNPMEHLQQRLDALKQQEANLLMQLDEVRVLIQAYENTLNKDDKGVG
jgi:hypothetical protein